MDNQYQKLRGLIKAKYGSQDIFADKWGRSARTVCLKLAGKRPFNVIDIEDWCVLLGIKTKEIPEYFFPNLV